MRAWLEGIVGQDYAVPVIAGAAALVALIVLFVVWRLLRFSASGTNIVGGRNRKTRLAVMDATAVDAHRRLVLVRRDDVEHLILIGGSADIVVERDIRLAGQVRRPAPPADVSLEPQAVAEPAPPPRPAQPSRPVPVPSQPRAPTVLTRPTPAPPVMRPVPSRVAVAPVARVSPSVAESAFDDELLRELEVELDADGQKSSLDDEMSKLLGELAPNRR